jgi:transcriptional regulator with XRE-family HTH domain
MNNANIVDASVGRCVRRAREKGQFSQSSIADILGISETDLDFKELGFRRFSPAELVQLAGLLSVTVAYFFSELNQKIGAQQYHSVTSKPRRGRTRQARQ